MSIENEKNLQRAEEGGAEIKHHLSKPEGYMEEGPLAYPMYQVAEVLSGSGTVAPRLGKTFKFLGKIFCM